MSVKKEPSGRRWVVADGESLVHARAPKRFIAGGRRFSTVAVPIEANRYHRNRRS